MLTKAWDWTKNTDAKWLVPAEDMAFLSECWRDKGFRNLLDLGCGLGRNSVYMAKKGFSVSAADSSPDAVQETAAWAAREGLEIPARVSDMLDLPYPDGAFDCAIAFNVIQHTDAAGFCRAIAELRRVIRPGGEAFLTILSKENPIYKNAPDHRRVDGNTVLRSERETEDDVPHFYAGREELSELFRDWTFLRNPEERTEYDPARPEKAFSCHWAIRVGRK